MNKIKLLFSSCSYLLATFNQPGFNVQYQTDRMMSVECEKADPKDERSYLCLIEDVNKGTETKNFKKTAPIKSDLNEFRYAAVGREGFILTNNKKTQVFQVKGSKAIFQERKMTEEESRNKVCMGQVSATSE